MLYKRRLKRRVCSYVSTGTMLSPTSLATASQAPATDCIRAASLAETGTYIA